MPAPPTLTPASTVSAVRLPATGSTAFDASLLPFGIYAETTSPLYSTDFVSGAADQVAYTYYKLGGDVLDIELTDQSVYAFYEEAVLEYSYHINQHQARNVLQSSLGATTGTFDHDGNLLSGELSSSLSGTHVALKFPKFAFSYTHRVATGLGQAAFLGGTETEYSASFPVTVNQQDYDLQAILEADTDLSGVVGDKRVIITKVFYKTPRSAWRFYGYYGGLTTIGNFHNYGQWADDSTFEVIPVWHNKLQAIQYENAIYTRLSHFSYEIKNNKLRLYPPPTLVEPKRLWVRFYVPTDAWTGEDGRDEGLDGVNNMNTLPFANIPFENINSIGKHWIRDYALALAMETLGYIRSKFTSLPVPGESVTLNGPELLRTAKEEQNRLRDQLKEILDQMTYVELAKMDAEMADAAEQTLDNVPMLIHVG